MLGLSGSFPSNNVGTPFRAKLVPDNLDGRLQDGMFARVTIRGREQPDAVRIPLSAIVRRYAFAVVRTASR